jgi:hypothetical protein
MSSVEEFLSFVDNVWIVVVNFLDRSVVSYLAELVFLGVTTCKLLFELVEMLLLDREDSPEDVPIDTGIAGWSRYRSAINPPIVHIDEHH